jgi:hypothetical protein
VTVDPRLIAVLDLLTEEFPWVQYNLTPLVKRILEAVDPAPDLDRAEALIEKASALRLDDSRLTNLERKVSEMSLDLAAHKQFGGHMARGAVYPAPLPYVTPPPFKPNLIGDNNYPYISYTNNPNTGTGEVTP